MTSTRDIAKAAIDSAFEMLKSQGLDKESAHLARDLQAEISLRAGTVNAVLITPSGHAGPLLEKVKSVLEQKLNRPVGITERADKSLLGGAILEYGDERIDLSVRGALENARMHLTSPSSN